MCCGVTKILPDGASVQSENGDFGAISVRVDFHCRVIFPCVNEIEAMYERPLGKVKVGEIQLSLLRVTFHTMSLFYLRAQNLRAYARKNYTAVEI